MKRVTQSLVPRAQMCTAVIARHQQYITLDEIFLAEDICYNHGPLISPDTIKAFLFPYYQQLIQNTKARQLDTSRKLYIQVDTDGYSVPIIDLYREGIGMDMLDPFEVASGCDVVQIGRDYPDLINGNDTVWFHPRQEQEISDLVFDYNRDNPWLNRCCALVAAAVERWRGQVQCAFTDLGGNLDILKAQIGCVDHVLYCLDGHVSQRREAEAMLQRFDVI